MNDDKCLNDILQVQGINSKGYGTIPKLVMQDKRLTPQAKAIYAYFCSYAGAGKTAFPRMTKIIADLKIGKNTYYSHLKLLKEYGYIKAEQEKDKAGKFKRNIYTLMETLPIPQNRETAKKQVEPIPCLRDTAEPFTADSTTNINNNKINSFNNNRVSESAPAPTETQYGEFKQVRLTTEQCDELIRQYGKDKAADYINRLDRHMASTGKRYKNHFATVKKWIAEDENKAKQPEPTKQSRFCNFEQRDIDFAELERKEMEFLRQQKK